MIRLIAIDLDETLLTTDKRITKTNREAIKACLEKDIKVVTASGRFNEAQLTLIKEMNLGLEKRNHVGDGGGTIFNETKILKVFGTFEDNVYIKLVESIRSIEIPCFVTTEANVYYDIAEQPLREIYGKIKSVRRPYIFEIEDLSTLKGVLKFVFYVDNSKDRDKVQTLQEEGLSIFSAGNNLMEITTTKLSKYIALKELAVMEGVKAEEICCIGDSENDLAMIANAGLGLSVKNAMESVKAISHHVGEKTNNEDGVAWLLEKYIL